MPLRRFSCRQGECLGVLAEILRTEDILKVGFDLREERSLLRRKLGLEVKAVLDLGTVFRTRG